MTAAAATPQVDDRPPAPALGTVAEEGGTPSASERLRALVVVAVDRLAAAATAKVDEVADRLGDVAADAAKGALGGSGAGLGVGANAALQAGLAKMQGRNPVWAGIKGGFSAMSPGTRVAVGLLLILLAVLSPVLLLVLGLVLLIAAIVGAVRG
ncbi:hypothetical protein [Actinomycetospora cinnamomea]|uniref:Uncharacterized protein n=1 Tax=Actinomycetospora cinnamomea TaxID=663609 RepID=A0A2U1FA81_9PSEU|nr:hypothetical protein [Actinomycetospora cinnamomea]PVZ09093.1 hypothetical protein C8D89_107257 [Actinomycetospora cinnamomea]